MTCEDSSDDEAASDEADLPLERPAGSAVDDVAASSGVFGDAGLEDVQVVHPAGGEALAALVDRTADWQTRTTLRPSRAASWVACSPTRSSGRLAEPAM